MHFSAKNRQIPKKKALEINYEAINKGQMRFEEAILSLCLTLALTLINPITLYEMMPPIECRPKYSFELTTA